jgi:hypothetical protein
MCNLRLYYVILDQIVTYNCNDSGLYYKTTILTSLDLAQSLNYYRKIIIYDRELETETFLTIGRLTD